MIPLKILKYVGLQALILQLERYFNLHTQS